MLVPADETAAPFPDDPFPLLLRGSIEQVELIPWGSNYTFAAVLRGDGGDSCLAIYKPRRGEVPLRDFPTGTLYKRETAAYVLAHQLGWEIVPPTVVREDGPHGIGSLQLYVQPRADRSAHFERLRVTHADELRRIALFDLLANNADRKGGHCLLDVRGHLWGIDHGLTFHHVPKLRTVIWDVCGQPVPSDLLDRLASLHADPASIRAIRQALAPFLSNAELDALFARWDRLLANPCYPELDPYRNVPWPPF